MYIFFSASFLSSPPHGRESLGGYHCRRWISVPTSDKQNYNLWRVANKMPVSNRHCDPKEIAGSIAKKQSGINNAEWG
jgi:hypothetical protein